MTNFATNMPYTCPHCSYTRSWSIRRQKRKCKQCRREFGVRQYPVPTIYSTEREWKQCIYVFLRQRAVLAISSETGVPHCRVSRMVQLLRACMAADTPPVFTGPVEFDETYIGGQRKNKKLHIRRIKAKKGHGTEKLPIMGIFDRTIKQVYVEIMPWKLNMPHIIATLRTHAVQNVLVYTDGFKMYRGLAKRGFRHAYVDHDDGEYVRGVIHTNNMEGFWGLLKRKLGCIGGMRRDRLYLFVGEIAWKFNHRTLPLRKQEELLLALVKKFGGRN